MTAGSRPFLVPLAAALALATIHPAWAAPRLLKAKLGPPVVEALMGGCSLRCAYPWEVFSSSPRKPVYATNDNYARSAWIDDQPPSSVGATLEIRFPRRLPPELSGLPFYGFDIIDGAWMPDDGAQGAVATWKQHARIKKLRMFYNGKPLYDIALADSRRWQTVTFNDIYIAPGDTMTLQILEIYPGAGSQDAAVSELVLQGAH